MSNISVRSSILTAMASIFAQGRFSGIADIKAAGAAVGADGNAIGLAVEELAAEGLLAQNADGSFGLTQAGLDSAASLQAAPAAAAPAPVPQAAAPVAPGGQKGGAKKAAGKKAAAPTPQGQAAPVAQNGGFKMQYKTMDRLTASELATRVQEWTLAAEANAEAGQVVVAEGLMRTVSRATRRLNNMNKQAQS